MTHILLIHGHASSAESKNQKAVRIALEQRGHTITQFSVQRPVLADGSEQIVSVTECIRQVVDLVENIEEDVVAVGSSQGGILVAHLCANALVRAGVYIFGVVETKQRTLRKCKEVGMTIDALMEGKTVTITRADGRKVTYTKEWFEDHPIHDVPSMISQAACPQLFFAGGKDTSIPPEEVQKGFNAAKNPKKYVLLPESEHTFAHIPGVAEQIAMHIDRWLAENQL